MQRLMILAEELGAAARLVGDRDDAVDVRVVPRHVPELLLHELADARRAVHRGDDGDVIARADTAVLALETVEEAHLLARVEGHWLDVDADLVAVGGQLADVQVVAVDVVADGDVLRREADDLAVAPNRPTGGYGPAGHLVAGLDVDADGNPGRPVLEHGAGAELLLGDGDVVFGPEDDCSVGERISGHGALTIPPAPPEGVSAARRRPVPRRAGSSCDRSRSVRGARRAARRGVARCRTDWPRRHARSSPPAPTSASTRAGREREGHRRPPASRPRPRPARGERASLRAGC